MGVKARLDLDSSGFVQGLSNAEQKFGKVMSKMGGNSGGFRAFNTLLAGWGYALEESDGKAKGFFATLGRAALTAGLVAGVAKSFQMVGDAISQAQDEFEKSDFKRPSTWRVLAASLSNAWMLVNGFSEKSRENVAGTILGLEADPEKQAETASKRREKIVRNVIKFTQPQSVEEQLISWAQGTRTDDVKKLSIKFKELQLAEDVAKLRGQSQQSDQYAKIGLGVGYGNAISYWQQIADNTRRTADAILEMPKTAVAM